MQIDERDYDLADGSTTSALVLAILESREALILAITQMEELMRQGAFVHREDDALLAVAPDPHRMLPRPDRKESTPVRVRTSPRKHVARGALRLVESDYHAPMVASHS